MVHSPSREANWFAASQEIPRMYGTRRFITAFINACHLSLSLASSIQSQFPVAAVNEPAQNRLLTFRVPNLTSLFRCLGRTEVPVRVRGFVYGYFVAKYVLTGRSC